MKLYLAQCTTYDPEMDYPDKSVEILGIFSTQKLAEESFEREEKRVEHSQEYIVKHQCFRGEHEVYEFELDDWMSSSKELKSRYFLSRHGEKKFEWSSGKRK
jgi:hypothetical protein